MKTKSIEAHAHRLVVPYCRISLALLYIWFGLLKAIGASPAETLVHALFNKTIHFMSFETFYLLFAVFEIIIGLLFLIPKVTKFALTLFALHMLMTLMPLALLPSMSWSGIFIPSLTGQYIIKNLALIGCALVIAAYGFPASRFKEVLAKLF